MISRKLRRKLKDWIENAEDYLVYGNGYKRRRIQKLVKKSNKKGLLNKLKWLVSQRRAWAVVAGAGSALALQVGYIGVSKALAGLAAILGGWSLAKPKK